MPRDARQTRDRILASAYRLFYREGFLRAGVDAVATEAGVTKRTLYNHFPSKDALIAAVLAAQAGLAEAEIGRWIGPGEANPPAVIRRVFAELRHWAGQPGWRGSGFTRAAMELAWAPGHPARGAAAAHKRVVERLIGAALANAGSRDSAGLARAVVLLTEGAMALRLVHGDDAYLDAAEAAALRLVERHQ